jgi:hypothetical protein
MDPFGVDPVLVWLVFNPIKGVLVKIYFLEKTQVVVGAERSFLAEVWNAPVAAAVVGPLSALTDVNHRAFFSFWNADVSAFFWGFALGSGRPSPGSRFQPEGVCSFFCN